MHPILSGLLAKPFLTPPFIFSIRCKFLQQFQCLVARYYLARFLLMLFAYKLKPLLYFLRNSNSLLKANRDKNYSHQKRHTKVLYRNSKKHFHINLLLFDIFYYYNNIQQEPNNYLRILAPLSDLRRKSALLYLYVHRAINQVRYHNSNDLFQNLVKYFDY